MRRRLVWLHFFGPADALKSGTGNTNGIFMMTVEQQDAPWSFWLKFHERVVTCFAQIWGEGGAAHRDIWMTSSSDISKQ